MTEHAPRKTALTSRPTPLNQLLALVVSMAIALAAVLVPAPQHAFALATDSAAEESNAGGLHAAALYHETLAPGSGSLTVSASAEQLADRDALFAAYAAKVLESSLPHTGALEAQGLPTGNALSADQKTLLSTMRRLVSAVAAGTTTSTVFEMNLANMGVESIMGSWGMDGDAVGQVLDALMTSCPYELYWYDSVAGTNFSYTGDTLVMSMAVAPEYQDASTYSIDTTQSSRVKSAVKKAEAIVQKHAGKAVPARLAAYKSAICNLVSYDDESAAGNAYCGDPWQIINVFDGDPSTNVVCEGYSKAFAYLCDLSGFADVNCYTVSGVFVGGGSSEDHMWNIVHMDDGKNYLADVTNCDAGSIGAPDALFLASCASGSMSAGYSFATNGGTVTFIYDNTTKALLKETNLVVSGTPYGAQAKTSIAKAKVKVSGSRTFNAKAQAPGAKKVKVVLGGKTLVSGTDYSLSYKNAKGKAVAAKKVKAAGTYTVVVKGKGAYKGAATGTFTIRKAANPARFTKTTKTVSFAKTKAAAQRVKPLAVSSAKGKITYAKVSGSARLSVSKTTGKVTVKKGTKPGTYRMKVKARAAGNANYKAKSKTLVVKVRVI